MKPPTYEELNEYLSKHLLPITLDQFRKGIVSSLRSGCKAHFVITQQYPNIPQSEILRIMREDSTPPLSPATAGNTLAPHDVEQDQNQTAKDDMSQKNTGVDKRTFIDGTDIKTLDKEDTLRALGANNKVIKERQALLAELGVESPAIQADIDERKEVNVELVAHLETLNA